MLKDKWRNLFGIVIVFMAVFKFYGDFFDMNSFSRYIMVLSLGLSTIMIATDLKKFNIVHLFVFVLAGIQFALSKNITMAYVYYLCLGLYTCDFRILVKWFMIFNAAFFSIYLVSNLLDIHPTEYLEGRNDFGFGNPNSSFICMFLIWSSYFYYVFYSKKKIDFLVLFLMAFLMYSQTITRTGLLTAIMTALAFLILRKIDVRKKKTAVIIGIFPIFMSILSILVALFGNGDYYLNKILSHRPLYWHSYITHPTSGINLFGYTPNIRDILFSQRMPLDSGYIWTLYSMGIIVFVVIIGFLCLAIYNLCRENQKDKVLLIVSILIYCFAESILVDIASNISIILLVYGISKFDIRKVDFKKISLSGIKFNKRKFKRAKNAKGSIS